MGPTHFFIELENHIYTAKYLVARSKIGGKVYRAPEPLLQNQRDPHKRMRAKHYTVTLRPNITLFELTIPFNLPEALSAARSRKSLKSSYLQLISEDRGWSVSYFTLEIGSLGHFHQAAIRTLSDAFQFPKHEAKQVLKGLSKIVVSCSYHIFYARLSTSWDTNKHFCC